MPPAVGIPLLDADPHARQAAETVAGAVEVHERIDAAPRQVRRILRHRRRIQTRGGEPADDAAGGHGLLVVDLEGDHVRQAQGLEDGDQLVVAVLAGIADAEVEVDLAVGADADRSHEVTPASRTKSATVSFSPRSCGSMPAASRASSAAAPEP
ncbi:hypothetical protein QP028_02810 [Corynebacterium suedekumii]|nr:hypothetical protein QP028_02810 [Corynebacterium suedekumii]